MTGQQGVLVADAAAVLDDSAVQWLVANPGVVLASDRGKRLAILVPDESGVGQAEAALAGGTDLPVFSPRQLGERHVRKLRRKAPVLALSLDETTADAAERALFEKVYKGVTDVVTKYAWPAPALVVTRMAASLGLSPNAITVAGFVMMLGASWLFYTGDIGPALIPAWAMTFLDTVDGKLARVTVTSSRLGNWLDHGTDVIHPPLWWYCLALGLHGNSPSDSPQIWTALWVILGCYVAGRGMEIGFHRLFGFNPYIWRPFDSRFRLIVSRRNIILLIMTIGVAAGQPVAAFLLSAAWSVLSTIVQAVRLAQASAESRKGPVSSWLA